MPCLSSCTAADRRRDRLTLLSVLVNALQLPVEEPAQASTKNTSKELHHETYKARSISFYPQ